jgi:hypothetical protein
MSVSASAGLVANYPVASRPIVSLTRVAPTAWLASESFRISARQDVVAIALVEGVAGSDGTGVNLGVQIRNKRGRVFCIATATPRGSGIHSASFAIPVTLHAVCPGLEPGDYQYAVSAGLQAGTTPGSASAAKWISGHIQGW